MSIILWGVAALAAAQSLNHGRHPQPWIFVVLALEKIFYTATWLWWLLYKPKTVVSKPPCAILTTTLMITDAV